MAGDKWRENLLKSWIPLRHQDLNTRRGTDTDIKTLSFLDSPIATPSVARR